MPYLLHRAFQLGSMSSPNPCKVKITKSKLRGLHRGQIQNHMQKISILGQYLPNLAIFDSKLRLTKFVQIVIFQKNYKDIKNLTVLGCTKGFNLKSHEMIANLLHSYSSEK